MKRNSDAEDISPEYNFRDGARGKYAARYASGSNVIMLDPDVAEIFGSAAEVNAALRALAGVIRRHSSTNAT
jgi:hypothetical protein